MNKLHIILPLAVMLALIWLSMPPAFSVLATVVMALAAYAAITKPQ